MARAITPISQISHRVAEAGRIRMGRKTAKAMTYLDTFRFTSPDEDLIKQVADMYGGEVKPWHDQRASPAHQFEVIVNSTKIDVVLVPDPLDQWYEKWVGSGRERQCDGAMCETITNGPDGYEPTNVPCICTAQKRRECEPYTRLRVILPGVALRGVWRLQTKGWNALHELPGMVEMVESLTAQGRIVTAQLSVAKVEKMVNKRKSHFVVPKLELPFTPEQIVSGSANLTALPSGTPVAVSGGNHAELNAGAPVEVEDGDDVVDAEVVSDLELEVVDIAKNYGLDGGQLWRALSVHDEARIKSAIAKMKSGAIEPDGFDGDGRVIWIKHES